MELGQVGRCTIGVFQRRSQFGFPPPANRGSTQTTRLVPLTQGVRLDVAWPLLPPGSTTSCTNFLPLDGVLTPRSRLSSIGTLRVVGPVIGMTETQSAVGGTPQLWVSGATLHAILDFGSEGAGFSRASFTSAFGLGQGGGIQGQQHWEYAPTYSADLDENTIVAAGSPSYDTLMLLYNVGATVRYSYLTGAPKAQAVGAFDNYTVAMNVFSGSALGTRVQWCQRGNPSNWTGEGSGFEDLLEMRGRGTAIQAQDGRMILFGDLEIWAANTAIYPSQFQFYKLDPAVGCPFPGTIARSEAGFLFVGTDNCLRLLPVGGGPSTVLSAAVAGFLRNNISTDGTASVAFKTWGLYDPVTKCYHLFVEPTLGATLRGLVVNTQTGEWGYMDYAVPPACGVATPRMGRADRKEGLFFGNSTGTVYSTSSKLATDSGSVVTSKWQSAPIAPDLPGNYKQLTQVDLDYRATSRATVTLKVSQDGGNTYAVTAQPLALPVVSVSGRATSQMYAGGAFPTIELTSTDTGYELHRIDTTFNVGGHR